MLRALHCCSNAILNETILPGMKQASVLQDIQHPSLQPAECQELLAFIATSSIPSSPGSLGTPYLPASVLVPAVSSACGLLAHLPPGRATLYSLRWGCATYHLS